MFESWKMLFYVSAVRISFEIRTNLSISGEKRGKFCLKIIFFQPLFAFFPKLETYGADSSPASAA